MFGLAGRTTPNVTVEDLGHWGRIRKSLSEWEMTRFLHPAAGEEESTDSRFPAGRLPAAGMFTVDSAISGSGRRENR